MLTKVLHKINSVLDRIYLNFAGLLLVVLVVSSFLQVFTRYIMNNSLVGTEELARYCFIWMSLLGGSVAVGRWAHTSITILYDSLPDKVKKIVFCILNLLIISLSVIFVMGGITMMKATATQSTPTLQIPKQLIYLAVPLCGLGMALHSVEHIVVTVYSFSTKSIEARRESEQ